MFHWSEISKMLMHYKIECVEYLCALVLIFISGWGGRCGGGFRSESFRRLSAFALSVDVEDSLFQSFMITQT